MRKINYRPYVGILIVLCALMNFSHEMVESVRSSAIRSVSASWGAVHFLKSALLSVPTLAGEGSSAPVKVESKVQEALSAHVVFREPDSWSSSVWLNRGEKDNKALGKVVVAVNSPVVVGKSVVGVIEYVGYRQCRMRLITDANFSPSVRALRGGEQNRRLLSKVQQLLTDLETRGDLFDTALKEEVQKTFTLLTNKLSLATPDLYLAKGELHGNSAPLWRSKGQILQGVGFNYDYADEKGPARDLRTGKAADGTGEEPLLKMGDLLVTTGLDGVFPAGLHVATVVKIAPLKEGACSYELEAKPTCGDLNDLFNVHILPPLQFDKDAT